MKQLTSIIFFYTSSSFYLGSSHIYLCHHRLFDSDFGSQFFPPPLNTMLNILVVAIIFFFSVSVFVIFLHFYAKCFWDVRRPPGVHARRRIVVFEATNHEECSTSKGLDPSVIRSLKTVVYKSTDADRLDCAVCLSDFEDDETMLLLPQCNHGFHVDCINMWFFSHSTCPLCRNTVVSDGISSIHNNNNIASTEMSENMSSILGRGNSDTDGIDGAPSTSREEGVLMIDIPRRVVSEDDFKSPSSLVGTPMSALRRFLSREKKPSSSSPPLPPNASNSCCSSPRGGDIEQGHKFDL